MSDVLASGATCDRRTRRRARAGGGVARLDARRVRRDAVRARARRGARPTCSSRADVAGGLQSLTLLASAAGGIVFGVLADRWGRTRALMLSVLIYSVFTAACGFAQTALQLAVFRIFLGIGMGGEWASGAALVSETWPDARSRQGAGADAELVGDRLRAGRARELSRPGRARLRLARGVLRRRPAGALHVLGAAERRGTGDVARPHAPRSRRVSVGRRIGGPMLARHGRAGADERLHDVRVVGLQHLGAVLPAVAGGIGLSSAAMSGFIIVMQVGMWLGYVTFGFVSDRFGRKRTYVGYLVAAAVLVLAYTSTSTPWRAASRSGR